MDSLFDSLIPLLLILFYLFSGFSRKKQKDTPPAKEPSYPQPEDEPPTLREEIRRRFEERARQLEEENEPPQPQELPFDEPVPVPFAEEEETLLVQRERMTELRRQVAEIKSAKHPTAPPRSRVPHSRNLAHLRQRLRHPKAVAEAIVLMEILGTPVGLRKPHEDLRPQ